MQKSGPRSCGRTTVGEIARDLCRSEDQQLTDAIDGVKHSGQVFREKRQTPPPLTIHFSPVRRHSSRRWQTGSNDNNNFQTGQQVILGLRARRRIFPLFSRRVDDRA